MKLSLKKDTVETKKLKSLYQKEEEYSTYLGAVENAIASAYLLNRKLNDTEVIKTLKELKKNYESSSSNPMKKEILQNLSEATAGEPITPHELGLVFDYILWSIDNLNWLPDKQAYVKWITYAMELMPDVEEKKYVKYIVQWGRRNGLSKKQIDSILLRTDDIEVDDEEQEKSQVESEFFAMSTEERISFLMEKGTIHFDLLEEFLFRLGEENDWKTIQNVYAEFVNRFPDFVPIYTVMYPLYINKDKTIAKKYLKQGLEMLEKIPGMPEGLRAAMRKDMEKALKMDRSSSDNLWSNSSFTQSMSPKEMEAKGKTFHMKHDEDMNYNCQKCRTKISAHNRDWHDGMCDKCFDAQHFPEDADDGESQTPLDRYIK